MKKVPNIEQATREGAAFLVTMISDPAYWIINGLLIWWLYS